MRKITLTIATLLAFFVLIPMECTGENIRILAEDVLFGGATVIAGDELWRAGPGVTITVESALTIYGKLLLEGTVDAPVRVVMQNKTGYGLVVKGGSLAGENVEIRGSGNGIEIYGGKVVVSGGRITVSGIQVNARGMSELNFNGLRFEGGKAGVIFRTGSGGRVEDCVFEGEKRAGVYVHGTEGVTVSRSVFSSNGSGITLSLYGAKATVVKNRFEENGEGIRAEKFAAPLVTENYFSGNRYGMYFTKRSKGTVTGNVFDGDEVSVYIRYSSYPTFRKNVFKRHRRYAVMLESQSSKWEAAAEDAARDEQFGGISGNPRKNSGKEVPDPDKLVLPGEDLTGTLDFRENFWGDLTPEIAGKGPRGNITGIFDGRDMPEFEDRGEKYPLDTVDFGDHLAFPPEEGRR